MNNMTHSAIVGWSLALLWVTSHAMHENEALDWIAAGCVFLNLVMLIIDAARKRRKGD